MFCEKRDSVNRRSRGREFGEAPLRDGYAPLSRSSESRSIRRTFAGVRALTEPHASSASTPLPNLHERDGLPSVDNAANGCTTHGNASDCTVNACLDRCEASPEHKFPVS